MIRNVVVGRLADGVEPSAIEPGLQALRELRVAGLDLELEAGLDLGLREGNAHYVLTVDLPDEESYRVYDRDEEHNRIRRELFAPFSAVIERIQFRLS
ncbi:Dabb family protein [Pseudonocardia spirodelae]|uniref:Dabb family protein n=1 Tax=Pseudonocardia spirodelae TaxID=3133431 RepID=A0ABU8TB61_9PSEU